MKSSKHPAYISFSVSANGNAIQNTNMVAASLFLTQAIENDDVQEIHRMKSYSVDFNDAAMKSPLIQAIKKGHINSLRALLVNGANPLEPFSRQKPLRNPYCYAAAKGTPDMLRAMLDHHTPDAPMIVYMLKAAIVERNPEVIRFMVKRDLFRFIEKGDKDMKELAFHYTMYFPGNTRKLARAIYNKQQIDLEKFGLGKGMPLLSQQETEERIHDRISRTINKAQPKRKPLKR